MPYYMGRIERNYVEKANTRINMRKPPIEYLRMLYFDSCVYDRAVLQHLVDKVGMPIPATAGSFARHSGVEEEVAGKEIVPDALQHRAERRQHIGRERARARR